MQYLDDTYSYGIFRYVGTIICLRLSNIKYLTILFVGKYYRNDNPKADRKIPLLEDVFKTFEKIPINIDIKRNDAMLIEQVSHLIKHYGREKRCVWGNMTAEVTEKCYKQVSRVKFTR